jgi:ATP-dependent exoDNAse (exonuclease V) alpha subunit
MISRSSGRCSVAAAAYRSGQKLVDHYQGMNFDFTHKDKVDYSQIYTPDYCPNEFRDREKLWNAVEFAEKRKDAQTAREVEISIPCELNRQEKIELVQNYVNKNFVQKGMIADVNIHNITGHNPHAHIMLTTRDVTCDGFQKKNRDWNNTELLKSWRKNWEVEQNQALEKKGLEQRVDCRSYKEQGIELKPQIHLGANVNNIEKEHKLECQQKGIEYTPVTQKGFENWQILKENRAFKQLKNSLKMTNEKIQKITSEMKQKAQEKKQHIVEKIQNERSVKREPQHVTELQKQVKELNQKIQDIEAKNPERRSNEDMYLSQLKFDLDKINEQKQVLRDAGWSEERIDIIEDTFDLEKYSFEEKYKNNDWQYEQETDFSYEYEPEQLEEAREILSDNGWTYDEIYELDDDELMFEKEQIEQNMDFGYDF